MPNQSDNYEQLERGRATEAEIKRVYYLKQGEYNLEIHPSVVVSEEQMSAQNEPTQAEIDENSAGVGSNIEATDGSTNDVQDIDSIRGQIDEAFVNEVDYDQEAA